MSLAESGEESLSFSGRFGVAVMVTVITKLNKPSKHMEDKMKIYKYPSESAEARVRSIIERGLDYSEEDYRNVSAILEEVKKEGDAALVKYTNKFDCPDLTADSLRVTEKEFEDALNQVDDRFLATLDRAARQIESFHRRQLPNSWFSTERPGVFLGQKVSPVDGVGVYAPGAKGGMTPLVSSVLMGAIPAKIAGVKNISLMTPPREDGTINPHLLAAARITGIDAVYKAGSAWAIGALAYGTESVGKVDVIVGPGNIFVTLAKKIVAGTVGIDMIAGPSEIMVIADETGDPDFIAADLLSQAEHDAMASAILVTTSEKLAEAVNRAVEEQLKTLDRKETAVQSLENHGAVMIVPDLDRAAELANRLAPEHLELLVEEPFEYMGQIRNAGAIFMGNYTPEPVGDYIAGPNHVLPTAGTARFASALSVDTFIKKTSLIHYSREAFLDEAEDIRRLAEIEGLGAHANSIRVRLLKEK